MKDAIPLVKLALATAIAAAGMALSACGGETSNNSSPQPETTQPEAAASLNTLIAIEPINVATPSASTTTGSRVIILSASNLATSAANAFNRVEDGDTIVFPAGNYNLPNPLSIAGNPLGGD